MLKIKVHNISEKELRAVRKKFEESAKAVAMHKELESFMAGDYVGYYRPFFVKDRKFIVAPSRVFNIILEDILPFLTQQKPEIFGTYNAYRIVEEMHNINPIMGNVDNFIEWLSKDKYAYIFEVSHDEIIGDIFRLPLFNKIDKDRKNDNKSVFTGGVFHAFKHFSYRGVPLSTQPAKNDIDHPNDIIEMAILAFFINDVIRIEEPKPGAESKFQYNGKDYFSVFYLEEETQHYYLNSMRRA